MRHFRIPHPPARRRRLVAGLALFAWVGGGCARDEGTPVTMLPAASPAGQVFTGDPAGPAGRGVAGVENPYVRTGDQGALRQGEALFRQMNCADCHGYGGEGGMGPSLVDREWLFGDTPADKFVTVHRGRARGMPAYGTLLPDESIWQIVAYIDELGRRAEGERRRAGGEAARGTRQAENAVGGRH